MRNPHDLLASVSRRESFKNLKGARAQNRSHRITTERNHNREIRERRDAEIAALLTPTGNPDDDEPPF